MALSTGNEIFRHSVSVLRRHPGLLCFPLLVILTGLTVFCLMLAPAMQVSADEFRQGLWNQPGGEEAMRKLAQAARDPLVLPWAWIAGGWIGAMLIITFVNVAYCSQILRAFSGESVSVSGGFGAALAPGRPVSICRWALFRYTVGMVVDALDRVLGPLITFLVDMIGSSLVLRRLTVVPAFVGVSWTAAAQFVIPVMLNEPKAMGPVQYMRTSARMVERVWGHAMVVGLFGASAVGIYAAFGVMGLCSIAGLILKLDHLVVWGAIAGFCILCLADGINSIYRCGLYIYATEGIPPGPFDEELMNRAWTVRQSD